MKKLLVVFLFLLGASSSAAAAGVGIQFGFDSMFHNRAQLFSLGAVFDTNLASTFPLSYRADISFKTADMRPSGSPYPFMEDFFSTRQALGFRIFASPMHTVFAGPHIGLTIGQREFSGNAVLNIGIPLGALLGYNLHVSRLMTLSFDLSYFIDPLYSLVAWKFKHGARLNFSVMFRLPNDDFSTPVERRNKELKVNNSRRNGLYI